MLGLLDYMQGCTTQHFRLLSPNGYMYNILERFHPRSPLSQMKKFKITKGKGFLTLEGFNQCFFLNIKLFVCGYYK
ncbi:hypothetical protein RJT34_14368 [Clitoria ternatea]|uniref:Uncharacterized protein n=1 Tax=Clitoria ternatea TaxID=43366 RepID=A0AAN9JSD9_CLITE